MKRYAPSLSALAALWLLVAPAGAADNSWTNTAATGLWQDATKWSLLAAPTSTHSAVFITNVNTKTVTINSATPSGNLTISNLTMRGFGAGINKLQLTNAGVATPLRILNGFTLGTNAVLVVTNSVLQVDGVSGGSFSVDGSVTNLAGGLIIVTNSPIIIGTAATKRGNFTTFGGLLLATNVVVGDVAGSQGTLTVAGGTNTLSSTLFVGSLANATGTVLLTGGQLVVTNNEADIGFAGVGQMTIVNGTWLANDVYVGHLAGSKGTLLVAGGTNNIYSTMTLGTSACDATGIVIVNGGRLFVTNAAANAVLDVRSGTFQLLTGILTIDNLVITNSCGRFLHTGGTLSITTTNISANLDADGDGLPNSWEQSFGFNVFSDVGNDGASGDPDGDGVTNLQEYQLGTDPNDGSSPCRITAIAREGNDIRLTWTTVGGMNNEVQVSPGVAGGSYSNNFSDLSGRLIISGSGLTSTNYLDSGGATNSPARYYRILLIWAPPPVGPEYFFPNNNLPPLNGVYITIAEFFAQYGPQYLIRDMQLRYFLQNFPPPPPGNSQVNTFYADADFQFSSDGGVTFQSNSSPAQVTQLITCTLASGGTSLFDTEMLSLSISGGTLPPGVMIRESPTLASTGQTSIRTVSGGYMISSFFDVFTDLSVDGGATWMPASGSAGHIELRNDSLTP